VTIALTIVGCLLLAFALLCIAANWTVVLGSGSRGRHVSMILIIGAALGFAGCLLVPGLGWKAGVVLVCLDPGFLVAGPILGLAIRVVQRRAD